MHSRRPMTWRAGALLAVATCTLAGCSSDPAGESADQSTGSPVATPADTRQLSFLMDSGAAERVDARVDVPEGFDEGDDWYVVSADGDTFLGLWATDSVQRDACLDPGDDQVVQGASVEALASALADQESTAATAPADVTLASYEGLYVELTGPSDVGECDDGSGLTKARGIYGDSQLDRLWILHVDGQSVVVDASNGSSATADEVEALMAMVESLEIIPDAR